MKRIVIVGATSGIGLEVARLCIRAGWRVGAAGRRKEALEALRSEAPGQVETETIDITRDDGQPFDVTGLMMGRASENTDNKILALMFSSDDVTIDGATSIAGSSFIYNPDVSSNTTLRYVRQFDHVDFGSASSLNGQTCHVHLRDIESFATEEYRAPVKSGEHLASGTWDLTFELNYEDATVNLAAGQTTTFAPNQQCEPMATGLA